MVLREVRAVTGTWTQFTARMQAVNGTQFARHRRPRAVGAHRRAQIFTNLPAAVSALPAAPNVIWVTGPSKTAYVEGLRIEGVHAPGR